MGFKPDFTESMFSRIIYVSIFSCLFWFSGFVYLRYELDTMEKAHLACRTQALTMAWQAVIASHQAGVQVYFDTYIMQPRILELLQAAQDGSVAEQAVQRVKLYRYLYPIYQKLQIKDVRQIHFHTPDCRSFLRFHAPHQSGDSLNTSRPSVVIANRDQKVVQGFETGRVVAGFRNVFPINHAGRALGSVELSQPFEVFRREMEQLANGDEFMMVYHAPLLLPKLFEEQKKMYGPSPFSQDWLVEDPRRELFDSPPILSVSVQEVSAGLAGSQDFIQALDQKLPCSLAIGTKAGFHAVTLIPIVDVQGLTAAVLLAFSPAPEIDKIYQSYRLEFVIYSVIALFGAVVFFLVLQSKQAIAEKQHYSQLIANTISDGLYVMNHVGVITFVNDTGVNILGYSRKELLGQVAHELFHFHDHEEILLSECSICKVLFSDIGYLGEEVFTRKDGTSFVAEVASEPMYENGKIVSVVTIFRDITERKEIAASLQAAYDKLDMLSNNIETQIWCMVSPDTYGAVNRAHAKFCGFTQEAMEHKTLLELFPREDIEACLESNQAVFEGKCQIRLEAWVSNAQGERRLLSLIKTPKLGPDGRVEYAICSGEDITERKQMEEQLRLLCNTDPLTKAFNRRYFLHVLEAELQRSKRYGTPFSLVMCDVDHFKKVNDTFGHETGDRVLKEIVASIHERVRGADVFARWGGEEFVLLLANTSLPYAVPLVDDILATIRSYDFGKVGQITISFGVTAYREEDTIDTLLSRADKLLYAAKVAGRNCIRSAA